jgi:hypothetical protein
LTTGFALFPLRESFGFFGIVLLFFEAEDLVAQLIGDVVECVGERS